MRPALYIRVSTDEQATKGNSLFEQEERGIAYCKAMGWKDPVLYSDDGYSAKDMNRPELTRMLEAIKEKNHNIVITTKLDRLSRRLLDILKLVEYFEKYSCAYASISESFDTSTSAGKLSLQVLGAVAEFERERIRERVRENLLSLAKKGKLIPKAAYGYNVVDGNYEINLEESLIVKNVFKWTLEGEGPLSIARRLNQMGVPTKNGTIWNERQVRRMLSLESYIGQFVYNRKYRKGTIEVTRPEDEWIVIDNHHEPLIDPDTFQRVQDILNARKYTMKQHYANDRYLLTGLVVCGHCGHKMTGREVQRPMNRHVKVAYLYQCQGYSKKGVCFFHYIYRDALEQIIINECRRIGYANTGDIELVIAKDAPKLSEKTLLEGKLRKLDQRMQKQMEMYEDDMISKEDFMKARERIDQERREIKEQIERLEQIEQQSEQAAMQNKIRNALEDIMSDDRLRIKAAISRVIEKIEITDGGNEIQIAWRL